MCKIEINFLFKNLVDSISDLHSRKELGGIEFASFRLDKKLEVIIILTGNKFSSINNNTVELQDESFLYHEKYKINLFTGKLLTMCNLEDLDKLRIQIDKSVNALVLIGTYLNVYLIKSYNSKKTIFLHTYDETKTSILKIDDWRIHINQK